MALLRTTRFSLCAGCKSGQGRHRALPLRDAPVPGRFRALGDLSSHSALLPWKHTAPAGGLLGRLGLFSSHSSSTECVASQVEPPRFQGAPPSLLFYCPAHTLPGRESAEATCSSAEERKRHRRGPWQSRCAWHPLGHAGNAVLPILPLSRRCASKFSRVLPPFLLVATSCPGSLLSLDFSSRLPRNSFPLSLVAPSPGVKLLGPPGCPPSNACCVGESGY